MNDALGTCVVSLAEQYRSHADECFGWARTAKTAREREIFIQMAQTWLAAAVRAGALDDARQPIEQPSVSDATTAKRVARS
ncbi:MAG: hypothetical protein WBE48_16205 [Xanthobacteraceae bacterium]